MRASTFSPKRRSGAFYLLADVCADESTSMQMLLNALCLSHPQRSTPYDGIKPFINKAWQVTVQQDMPTNSSLLSLNAHHFIRLTTPGLRTPCYFFSTLVLRLPCEKEIQFLLQIEKIAHTRTEPMKNHERIFTVRCIRMSSSLVMEQQELRIQ